MRYKVLEGVVLARVCGQNLLVATRKVWGKCPYTKSLSPLRGAFWQGITQGMNEDEIARELHEKYGFREEMLKKHFRMFIESMKSCGYITAEDSER